MLEAIKNKNIEFMQREDGTYISYKKIRTLEPRFKPYRTMLDISSATADGSKLVKSIFDEIKLFNFPKPIGLITFLIQIGCKDSDLILDFFSGSAHAVMQLNADDGGNRKYIMVHYPSYAKKNPKLTKPDIKTFVKLA